MAQEPKPRGVEAVSEQRWRERIVAWRESGQTQQAFCQAQGCSMSSFSRWKIKLTKQGEVGSPAAGVGQGVGETSRAVSPEALRWTEVRWPERLAELAAPASSGFEIVLPRGWSVRLGPQFEPESLRRLLAVLEERSC
jgi:hypothetical protein